MIFETSLGVVPAVAGGTGEHVDVVGGWSNVCDTWRWIVYFYAFWEM